MAGAVSAGAYTAGVMDELLEALNRWEKAKQTNKKLGKDHPDYDHSIPMHKVELEVLSGASAGGITAALCTREIMEGYNRGEGEASLLEQCWVNMADGDDKNTLEKLLDPGDLSDGETPVSLLNGKPIEELANRYFTPLKKEERPAWFSDKAELILTTTNLEGIRLDIRFDQADENETGHLITQHSSVFRYLAGKKNKKKNAGDPLKRPNYQLDLTQKDDVDLLRDSALSTSAFPIGLPSRSVYLPHRPYLKFPGTDPTGENPAYIDPKTEEPYFNSVDGGLLNNEPYGWGIRILREKSEKAYKKERYAVIMIDPLPNKDPEIKKDGRQHIVKVATAMFRALRNEVMLNQEGLAEAISLRDRTKFLIAPRKGDGYPEELNALGKVLASAPLSGFAGFISKEQRDHDYRLGRKNCRDFIRFHFTLPLSQTKKRLGSEPGKEMQERFVIYPRNKKLAHIPFFPIVPDIRLEQARTDTPLNKNAEEQGYPKLPTFSIDQFRAQYQDPINKRLYKLVSNTTGKWWLGCAFKLFMLRGIRRRLYRLIDKEMHFSPPSGEER